ncbi:AaceriAAR131Wp [[Ashbya] aceris (nom. inval.)]|nr:AaceriAAR131Wp [[Ashbya] aceris (nom. inval.)]
MDEFVTSEDLVYEYSVLQEPDNLVNWSRYIAAKRDDPRGVSWVYERCLQALPEQWDIWREYLQFRMRLLDGVCAVQHAEQFASVNMLFWRCVEHNTAVVEAWRLFLEHARRQGDLELLRHVVDGALRGVPLVKHRQLWEDVVAYIDAELLPAEEAALEEEEALHDLVRGSLFGAAAAEEGGPDIWSSAMLRRYIQVAEDAEAVLPLLQRTHDYATIVAVYEKHVLPEPRAKRKQRKSYETQLRYLVALDHTRETTKLEGAVARCAQLFPERAPSLTILLAKHYVKLGNYNKSTEVLKDALKRTVKSSEFASLYDFLVLFEEAFIEVVIDHLKEHPQDESRWDNDLESHTEHLESLLADHAILLNDLKLRQEPDGIKHWLERVELFDNATDKASVYADAIASINYKSQVVPGQLGTLWWQYAQLYIDDGQYETAKTILDKALNVPYNFLQDPELIWTKWAEEELRRTGLYAATAVLSHALQIPDDHELLMHKFESHEKMPAQTMMFTSLKLWSFYIDLLEAGSDSNEQFERTKEAYEATIKLKIATPLLFVNYAHFLQDKGNHLESFSIYERAVDIFPGETAFEIWDIYIAEALEYGLPKEQIRDLFESSLQMVHEGVECKPFFLLYAKFECNNGMLETAMNILHRACRAAQKIDTKVSLWTVCLNFCRQELGGSHARALYEECIQALPNHIAVSFVVEYAQVEEDLKQVNRARSLLNYGAQLLHPSDSGPLWEYWELFELRHGNKDTYKDMLQLKRQVEDLFDGGSGPLPDRIGNIEFVASKDGIQKPGSGSTNINDDELVLDM